jgi:wobble nucleotide-excising tRNase
MLVKNEVKKGKDWRGEGIEFNRNSYSCDYCGCDFVADVRTSQGNDKVSDKVVCPSCNNFLKTWR